MAINNFIPQVWAGAVLRNLHKAQTWVQPGIANRDYQGTIASMGDTVKINAIGPVTVSKYSKNTQISNPQTLQDAGTAMAIDQGDYFNFQVDDVDAQQQMPKVMDTAMWEAAYGLSDSADKFVANLVITSMTALGNPNTIGTDTVPVTDLGVSAAGFSTAYDYLVKLGVFLDKANVPAEGRWAIVPPMFHGYLKRDLRFVGYGTDANSQILQNGLIGAAAGFTILKSNNNPLTNTTTYNVVVGYPGALSFAEQISNVEAYRHPNYFADAVRGLHIYGAKITRPQGLAVLKCTDPGT